MGRYSRQVLKIDEGYCQMKESYLMYSDIEDNSNKTLYIKADGATLSSSWGRVGDALQTKTWDFASPELAEKMYSKKIKEKLKKGYELVDTFGAGSSIHPGSSNLANLATQEIDVDSENTRELVRWLTTQNIHNICENTTIQYTTEGLFKTPIGVVVSQATIDRARKKLAQISNLLSSSNYDISLLTSEANAYLRLIPQNLGRARDKLDLNKIFIGEDKLAKQADILDSLEASLLSLLTQPTAEGKIQQRPKTFECRLRRIEDREIIKKLDQEITSSKKSSHLSALYGLKDVYEVEIPSMATSWQNYGAKLSNIQNLYHGTRVSNLLSILKRGLVTPKSGIAVANGSAFGLGTYFSNSSTKSLNYSVPGTWFTGNEKRYFMFIGKVALGKYYVPKGSYDGPFPRSGHDSTWAQGGKSGVNFDEIVIYREDQCNLIYLCEFAK
jgi:poly [ADP-ribose] polymerase